MNITRFTDYSLRVLIYLSLHKEELVTIKDIAERYQISKNHLMKVVQELSAKGYLNATRGKNGGIKLNRAPNLINIGKLVRMTEKGAVLVECFGESNQCVITPSCQLKRLLNEALECFFKSLEQYTLNDLIGDSRGKNLGTLLGIERTENFKS